MKILEPKQNTQKESRGLNMFSLGIRTLKSPYTSNKLSVYLRL